MRVEVTRLEELETTERGYNRKVDACSSKDDDGTLVGISGHIMDTRDTAKDLPTTRRKDIQIKTRQTPTRRYSKSKRLQCNLYAETQPSNSKITRKSAIKTQPLCI